MSNCLKKCIVLAGLLYGVSFCMNADDAVATELINRFNDYKNHTAGLSQKDQYINAILFSKNTYGSALMSLSDFYGNLSLAVLQAEQAKYQAQQEAIENLIEQNRPALNDLNINNVYQRFLMVKALLDNALAAQQAIENPVKKSASGAKTR